MSEQCPGSEVVTGTTPTKEREAILERFKTGETKALLNVSCLTTGYDKPSLDTIILNRPTRSLSLLVQMLGRAARIHPGKEFATIIDFTDTIRNMGRFETVRVEKHSDGWQLLTETGSWHNKQLFSYEFALKKK
jgi:DNA repair protein RadD